MRSFFASSPCYTPGGHPCAGSTRWTACSWCKGRSREAPPGSHTSGGRQHTQKCLSMSRSNKARITHTHLRTTESTHEQTKQATLVAHLGSAARTAERRSERCARDKDWHGGSTHARYHYPARTFRWVAALTVSISSPSFWSANVSGLLRRATWECRRGTSKTCGINGCMCK